MEAKKHSRYIRFEGVMVEVTEHICSEGVGGLIPFEEKWKLTNHSTYMLKRNEGFHPFCREVEVNKPANIFVQRGRGG